MFLKHVIYHLPELGLIWAAFKQGIENTSFLFKLCYMMMGGIPSESV